MLTGTLNHETNGIPAGTRVSLHHEILDHDEYGMASVCILDDGSRITVPSLAVTLDYVVPDPIPESEDGEPAEGGLDDEDQDEDELA